MNPIRLLGLMAGLLVGTGSSVGVESMLADVHGVKPSCLGASPRPPVPSLAQFGRKGGRGSGRSLVKPAVPWCTKHYAAPLPGETDADCKVRKNVLKRQRKAEAANTRAHNIARDLWSAAGRRSNQTLARSANRQMLARSANRIRKRREAAT